MTAADAGPSSSASGPGAAIGPGVADPEPALEAPRAPRRDRGPEDAAVGPTAAAAVVAAVSLVSRRISTARAVFKTWGAVPAGAWGQGKREAVRGETRGGVGAPRGREATKTGHGASGWKGLTTVASSGFQRRFLLIRHLGVAA